MTARQSLLKLFYPILRLFSSAQKNKQVLKSEAEPKTSFYSLDAELNNGQRFSFESLHGKKVLLVNTASDCGYTAQYEGLQKIADENPNIVVLVFPSNDFKQQETRDDAAIAEFCKVNYGLTVPLFKKTVVKKQPGQSPVFAWLTDAQKNGWNNNDPLWNFNKYLVNGQGKLTHVFGQAIDPLAPELKVAIQL